jgi:hypothetical protein
LIPSRNLNNHNDPLPAINRHKCLHKHGKLSNG